MGTTQYRTYTHYQGKSGILAWMDKHCIACGRFLKKRQMKYCSECSDRDMKKGIRYLRERTHRLLYAKEHNKKEVNK